MEKLHSGVLPPLLHAQWPERTAERMAVKGESAECLHFSFLMDMSKMLGGLVCLKIRINSLSILISSQHLQHTLPITQETYHTDYLSHRIPITQDTYPMTIEGLCGILLGILKIQFLFFPSFYIREKVITEE